MYIERHRERFIKTGQIKRGKTPPIIDFHSKIVEMDVARKVVKEGAEDETKGRRFIKWTFDKRLGTNKTPV